MSKQTTLPISVEKRRICDLSADEYFALMNANKSRKTGLNLNQSGAAILLLYSDTLKNPEIMTGKKFNND